MHGSAGGAAALQARAAAPGLNADRIYRFRAAAPLPQPSFKLVKPQRRIAWHVWERAFYESMKLREQALALLGGSSDEWYYSVSRCALNWSLLYSV